MAWLSPEWELAEMATRNRSSLFHHAEPSLSRPSCIQEGPRDLFSGLEWKREWSHQARLIRRSHSCCTCPSLSAHWTAAENLGT